MACYNRYGDSKNFLQTFNPSKQYVYCGTQNLQKLYMGEAPSLGVVTVAYGEDITDLWLAGQIRDLANFSGAKEKLREEQYEAICGVIKATFGYMKVTELMHFFLQFKSGKYGKFYGAVDGLVIMEALQEFARERFDIVTRYQQEAEAKRKAAEEARHEAEVRSFRTALAVSNMTIAEWLACDFPKDFTHEELAEVGWLFRMGYEPEQIKKEMAESNTLFKRVINTIKDIF